MNKKTTLILFIILGFVSCKNNQEVKITSSGSKDYPEIIIQNVNLGIPFIITGNKKYETGSIYFETNNGKTWINGEPNKMIKSEDLTEAKWTIENREIIITFNKKSDNYAFTFTAFPDDDVIKWGFGISAEIDEYFTGLFERVVDGDQKESWKEGIKEAMNLHGQKVDMIIKPTLSLYCPFYISSNGYGIFINGTWPGHYDFCQSDPERVLIEFEGNSLSGIIYIADNPADIVKMHSLSVGPSIIPPKWAFLPWSWRDNLTHMKTYYDGTPVNAPFNSMVVEDILIMKALDIPCGLYWIDRPWAKGFRGYEDFEWDTQRFPDAKEMISWIHSNNMKFLLWIAPWVTGEMKNTAIKNNYSQPLKDPHGNIDSTNIALLDFTNPDACKWWQENGIEKMLKQGVNGFKLDRSEELVPETNDIILNDGRTAREVRNEYPILYVKTVNESCKKIYGDDFILIPRAGYSGSSKYSGFWGGDIGSPPEGLRAAIIAAQRSSIIGFPIWGSDIGGYWQGDLDREVCARWLAFGCFNPIMEFGPTEDRAPWNMDSEPNYDTTLIAIWRLYAKIHASLANYTFNHVKQAHETGMPVIRPLFLEFPEQEEAWNDWQTFMYGEDILVSAIWQKNKKSHTLYLPANVKWIDAWNLGKVYEGGQYIEMETPIYKIPIFIRAESEVKLGDLNEIYNESLKIASEIPNMKILEQLENFKIK